MESSEHNSTNISETICPEMLCFASRRLGRRLSEYFDKSHHFTALTFYDVTLYSCIPVISPSDISPLKTPDKDVQ